MIDQTIRISMLHFSPTYVDAAQNVEALEKLLLKAAENNPDIVITPELAVSGYEFPDEIGLDWIKTLVPQTIKKFSHLAKKYQMAIILGSPIYKEETERYHNAAIFIDERGQVIGQHYKINVIPGGSEAWATPGNEVKPIAWGEHKVGILICADAYTDTISAEFKKHKTNVVISPAAWAPGLHGPNGEWEQRSKETGLCYYVCNRTGKEKSMDFCGSNSVIVADGHKKITYSSENAAILTIDVNAKDWIPIDAQFIIKEV